MKLTTYIAPAVAALAIASPAQSNDNLSANEQELYWYAYAYGMVVDSCMHYDQGNISKNDLKLQLKVVYFMDPVSSSSKATIQKALKAAGRKKRDVSGLCSDFERSVGPRRQGAKPHANH